MSIEFWIVLWKVLLVGAVAAFAGLAVLVTIGGFVDVFRLLKRLQQAHARSQEAGEGDEASTISRPR